MDTKLLKAQDSAHVKEIKKERGMYNDDFYDIYIRMGFLRKVYGLLSLQIIVTTVVASVFAYAPVFRDVFYSNHLVIVINAFVSIGLLIALCIKQRHFPINLFLLLLFNIVNAISIGIVIRRYDADFVVKSLVSTLIITASLTVYTFQTKYELTRKNAGLLISILVFVKLRLINVFLGCSGLELALSGISTIIFCFYFVFDTQMMMHKLNPEDYIVATISLYIDILEIFLNLLRLFGDRKRK